MGRVNKTVRAVAGALLAISAGSAFALDTREVVVEKHEGLVEVPRHLGHVLATPNRDFSFDVSPEDGSWRVLKNFERYGKFIDRSSYLKHPDNLFHQTTYFEFDDVEPINADVVADRLRQRLGYMSDEGLTFVVVGHADEVGTQAYNRGLSVRRAKRVVDLLVAAGHDAKLFEVIGRGKLDPVSFTDQALNRRVEVVVRGDKKAKATFQKMKSGQGALTCRACIGGAAVGAGPQGGSATLPAVPSRGRAVGATEPIGREQVRQPSTPTTVTPEPTRQATAEQAEEKPAANATMEALQRLRKAREELTGEPNFSGHRADQNPMGFNGPASAAPSLQDILGRQSEFPQANTDVGVE